MQSRRPRALAVAPLLLSAAAAVLAASPAYAQGAADRIFQNCNTPSETTYVGRSRTVTEPTIADLWHGLSKGDTFVSGDGIVKCDETTIFADELISRPPGRQREPPRPRDVRPTGRSHHGQACRARPRFPARHLLRRRRHGPDHEQAAGA